MKQCHLQSVLGEHYHCWLPSKFAIVGKIVDIEADGVDLKGYYIREVWTELPTAVVKERSQDYKKTRRASDI